MTTPRNEAALLKQYRLQDPFPTTWSDPIEDEQEKQRVRHRKSTSRYSILQEDGLSSSLKGLVGGDLYAGGPVPEDESDPLGTADSVVRVLRKRGIPVEDNVRLRNRYFVSSKHFSPSAFLRDVHASTPSPVLQQGLGYLGKSIAQKSGSLKVLVETNFDRFVAAKATIEGVYKEMKENAFLSKDKEIEYGVGGIRKHLKEADSKANEIFGPIMTGRGKEEGLRTLMQTLEKHSGMLDMPSTIYDCVRRRDHELLLEEYHRARQLRDEARALVPNPKAAKGAKEEDLHQLIIAEKMWVEVEAAIAEFRRTTWRRLLETRTEENTHIELIGVLMEIGAEDNPVSVWLLGRFEYIKNRIATVYERSRIEVEIVRRKVAAAPRAKTSITANHLRAASRRTPSESYNSFDTTMINSFWEAVHSFLTQFLDPSKGILGELLNFWKAAQSFIDGDILLPSRPGEQTRSYYKLPQEDVLEMQGCAFKLVNALRDVMVSFFQDPPVEDISALYSPTPGTPTTPISATPITPQLPKMAGQTNGDDFAFYPLDGNSLGGAHYLCKATLLLGNAATALAEAFFSLNRPGLDDGLRSLLNTARERMVTAVCASWLRDAQNCKVMEDWTRSADNRSVTKMPHYFLNFEKEVIFGMQSIVYLDKVRNNETKVIPPPSAKLLANVRGQFVRSLYQALQGMVENCKRPIEDDSGADLDLAVNNAVTLTAASVRAEDKNVRMLLTLSNLQLLKANIVPELISQFEQSFSLKLSDESKTVRDVLGQIDAQLFEEYTRPLVSSIASTIRSGILSPSWSPAAGKHPSEVRPYIYDALLQLVEVHAQVTTTAPNLISQILSYLLEQLSKELLESFKQRKSFSLGELLQATLDVEFVNQTLGQYATKKASEYQQLVYVELDRGSNAEARQGLQKELAGMKNVLSSLRRSSRAEFLCFRVKKSSGRRTNAHLEAGTG